MPDMTDEDQELLESIDAQIEAINQSKVVRKAEQLIARRDRLYSARRALLGAGNKLTGAGGTRITQAQVVAKMTEDPDREWDTNELAEAMGTTDVIVRGHLNRGKDERFTKLTNNKWVLRDPETEEDDDGE